MSNETNRFARAVAAFQRQDWAQAQAILQSLEIPATAHLRGLVERRLGHFDRAAQYLQQAVEHEPSNHEIHHNQALVWLDLRETDRALAAVQAALRLDPDFLPAHRTLGRALRQAGRWDAALTFYQQFARGWPTDRSARYGLATALLETGQTASALAQFSSLVQDGATDPAMRFMQGRAALELGQLGLARESLEQAHAAGRDALSLRELGRLYWMQNDLAAFRQLVQGPFDQPESLRAALELKRESGASLDELMQLAAASNGADAQVEATLAQACVDQARPAAAYEHADRSLQLAPGNEAALAAKISACLMTGDADQALALSRDQQQVAPDAQQWIAFEATALRLTDERAYRRLVDVDHHVRVYELSTPPGYDSMDAFNRALEASLDRHQPFAAQPIDQSLRLGTQTPRDLRWIDDPVIQAYLAALDRPIRQYIGDMGQSTDHPLTRRNTGNYRLNGCWSVRLTGGGHHVNHMHPEGWISSAYYVRVPRSGRERSGWIKFGEPPFATTPALTAERWIEPQAGMLVLFPSFLWHGTEPIDDDAVRVTAPFDAVPAD